MTSTNRFANRLLLVLVGVVLLGVGSLGLGVVLVPSVRRSWDDNAAAIGSSGESVLERPAIPGTGVGWVLVGALAAAILLIVLLAAFIVRQGGGRTDRLVVQQADATGTTIIESRVADDLLQTELARVAGILTSHVTTYSVRGRTALKIAVTCRRGASPQQIRRSIDDLLVAFDDLLGLETPAFVQIGGGVRARLSSRTRVGRADGGAAAGPAAVEETVSPAAA